MVGRRERELVTVLAAVLDPSAKPGDASLAGKWEHLYPLWRRYLFRVGAKLGLRADALEDMIQDVFRRILSQWEKYRDNGPEGLLSLSCRAMCNRVIDEFRYRNRWRIARLDAVPEDSTSAGANHDAVAVGGREQYDSLSARLVELKGQQPENCKLLCLHYLKRRSYKELAAKEGCSVNAVKCRIRRALAALRGLAMARSCRREPQR